MWKIDHFTSHLFFTDISPWNNRHGWLGVKYITTYVSLTLGKALFSSHEIL